MKAQPINKLGLKLMLFLLLGLNMSWFHDIFTPAIHNTELASETAPTRNSFKYDRNYEETGHKWNARITQVKRAKTDPFGNLVPEGGEEIVYKWSAKLEGCYGKPNCRATGPSVIRAEDLGMSEGDFKNQANVRNILTRIQEEYDGRLDDATKKLIEDEKARKKEEEREKKELAAQEKLEKEIDKCLRDEDGEKISGYIALTCKAKKLGNHDGEELELAFDEMSDELRALLASGDASDRRRGKKLLGIMGVSGYSKDINYTLRAMKAGASYLDQYTSLLRTSLTSTNPWQRSQAQNKLTMLNQRYQMDSYAIGNNPVANDEFQFWQQALNQNIELLVNNPHATLPGAGGSAIGPELPSVFNNLAGRTARRGGINPITSRQDWYGMSVTAPQNTGTYLTVNPYVDTGGRKLTIPQINQMVTRPSMIRN